MSLCAFLEDGVLVEEIRTSYYSKRFFFWWGWRGVFLDWSMTVVEYLNVYKQPFNSMVSWFWFTL
jgi:hypothetical protein